MSDVREGDYFTLVSVLTPDGGSSVRMQRFAHVTESLEFLRVNAETFFSRYPTATDVLVEIGAVCAACDGEGYKSLPRKLKSGKWSKAKLCDCVAVGMCRLGQSKTLLRCFVDRDGVDPSNLEVLDL